MVEKLFNASVTAELVSTATNQLQDPGFNRLRRGIVQPWDLDKVILFNDKGIIPADRPNSPLKSMVEPRIMNLVRTLQTVPGFETTYSCEGHWYSRIYDFLDWLDFYTVPRGRTRHPWVSGKVAAGANKESVYRTLWDVINEFNNVSDIRWIIIGDGLDRSRNPIPRWVIVDGNPGASIILPERGNARSASELEKLHNNAEAFARFILVKIKPSFCYPDGPVY
jgi:hypothetical protein